MRRARLRALRMTGFKSFAERTTVEFGPGISAVIGPNGSGKSNLADALRWSLGEQGRALRTRRAEDLIFAGSSTRKALGMADVTLVIDNEDRLLPVEFGEIELGRRVFRSGENEYLLNRQRIRLRDLVDLLDEGNLADNAFLFIGQGMVDQALALRPEERRPLFEEAAGPRKHERRRRAAEAELAEAEANLERVRDLLGELRPQARRLAAQAEQAARRRDAAAELATALVAAAGARLRAAGSAVAEHAEALAAARVAADAALAALRAAEEEAEAIARTIAERAETERSARARLDAARARVVDARLEGARIGGDGEAAERERVRLTTEAAAVAERLDAAVRALAEPVADADAAAEETLRALELAVAEQRRGLDELRETGRGDAERLRMARAEREARRAQAAQLERRAADAAVRLAEAHAAAATAEERAAATETTRTEAAAAAAATAAAEAAGEVAAETARGALASAEAAVSAAQARLAEARAALGALTARARALDAEIAAGRSESAALRIRAAGGRSVSVGIEIDPALRRAAEAAIGEALRGELVPADVLVALADLGGTLVLAGPGPAAATAREGAADPRALARLATAAGEAGGGLLRDAIRRDPDGLAARLIGSDAWVPDLPAALAVHARGALPPGSCVATRDGAVVTETGVVRLPAAASLLERRAERGEVTGRVPAAEAAVAAAEAEVADAGTAATAARGASASARAALDAARRDRRVADEADRGAQRRAEAAAREAAWATGQVERLARAAEEAAAARDGLAAELRRQDDEAAAAGSGTGDQLAAEIAARQVRLGALTEERDAALVAVRTARARADADRERVRRAELVRGIDGARAAEIDRELARLAGSAADIAARREAHAAALAAAGEEEERARAAVAALEASGSGDRARLLVVERAAGDAREELRRAEARARAAEVRLLELRVQLDAAREGLLVELAAIGPEGIAALRAVPGVSPAELAAAVPAAPSAVPSVPEGGAADAALAERAEDDRAAALEAALDAAIAAWQAPGADDAQAGPAPARLAQLRRRYHELGAGNPYAAEELTELTTRLDALEAQRVDLEGAIRSTRELIARLETLIAEQFRTTFAALEGAFARRFTQLFDGGEAQLALTQPDDLGATGVEIVARPPGKRRQPLAMLSGGERALTAVALLLAMLEVRPVPFCVLDEVDAALDEANVGRFSAALRSLAAEIQFVVITHNRGTIEAADALYGVTVGDDAVSRVISLRLGDRADAADDMADAGDGPDGMMEAG
ncbi:MAG: chromosome segregation protein SMC [Chloroflexota bacterium]